MVKGPETITRLTVVGQINLGGLVTHNSANYVLNFNFNYCTSSCLNASNMLEEKATNSLEEMLADLLV